jgi:hypothetical protein
VRLKDGRKAVEQCFSTDGPRPGTGPSSYRKTFYRAAVSQRLRTTAVEKRRFLHCRDSNPGRPAVVIPTPQQPRKRIKINDQPPRRPKDQCYGLVSATVFKGSDVLGGGAGPLASVTKGNTSSVVSSQQNRGYVGLCI